MKNYTILLGSGSPRRRQLLADMGIEFKAIKIKDVDESYPADMLATEVPLYLSKLKSDTYRDELHDGEILITADTVVISDGMILGKPKDENEAIEMLRALSNRSHDVVTGVTLATKQKTHSFAELTKVFFANLTEDEIAHYVETYRPLDKAGAYGIQEWIGMIGVDGIDGCFYNVMGLPTARLYRELCDFVKS